MWRDFAAGRKVPAAFAKRVVEESIDALDEAFGAHHPHASADEVKLFKQRRRKLRNRECARWTVEARKREHTATQERLATVAVQHSIATAQLRAERAAGGRVRKKIDPGLIAARLRAMQHASPLL